jgi:polyhydroxyalkanoate synthesis regulator phasin
VNIDKSVGNIHYWMHSGQGFGGSKANISWMDRKSTGADGERGLYPRTSKDHIPLWIPASNYYFLVIFFAAAVFLTVLAWLYDGYDDTPWIVGGISAAAFAASLILFREVILRRFRRRALAARRLSHQLRSATQRRGGGAAESKITLQRNVEILRDIRTKSDAAKVLGKLAEAHKEVSDLCEQYLTAAADEISSARPGSPRIPALRKGSKFAAGRHRFHMLKWAEIKARSFSVEAGSSVRLSDKLAAAEEALDAVDRAMRVYPEEAALVDSRGLLQIFLVSARIKDSIEKAERANAMGSSKQAVDHYREALSDLQNCGVEFSEREVIFERIRSEIGRISKLADV